MSSKIIVRSEDIAADKIVQLTKITTAEVLKTRANQQNVVFSEYSSNQLPFWEQMVTSVIGGHMVSVLVKIHYDIDSARIICSRAFQTSPDNMTNARCVDFFKEYLNVVSGNIKTVMANVGIFLGSSIPVGVSGYNEIFFKGSGTFRRDSCWKLIVYDCEVGCSIRYEIRKKEALSKIEKIDLENIDNKDRGLVVLF